jgi:hypothetical protein
MPVDGRIHVRRAAGRWTDRLRAYKVVLDGDAVGTVKRGETLTCETAPGSHVLHLEIDWCRSPSVDLEVAPGKDIDVRCWPNARAFTVMFWMRYRRDRYIGIEVGGHG